MSGGGVSQHVLQVSKPTPRGKLRGLAGIPGVSRPTPRGRLRGSDLGVSRPTLGGGSPGPHLEGVCIPVCTEADIPLPSRWLLLQVVRILLECIFVNFLHFRDMIYKIPKYSFAQQVSSMQPKQARTCAITEQLWLLPDQEE